MKRAKIFLAFILFMGNFYVTYAQSDAKKQSEYSFCSPKPDCIDVLFFLINFIFILLCWRRTNPKNEVPDLVKAYVRTKITDAQFKQSAASGNSKVDLRSLKDEIERLKLEVKQLNSKTPSRNLPLEIVNPPQEATQITEFKQVEVKSDVFFLSTPNSDGSFNESSASATYKEGASIYRFTRMGSGKAKFQLDERETSVKLAIQYPDKNIHPVCEELNAFDKNTKSIATKQVGEAELNGGKWIVNVKARISYEV